jgi:hypothetical protein
VLGTVSEVFRAGAGEVYVITGGMRGEVLVPAVRGIVTELAPAEGRLVFEPLALDLPAPRSSHEDLAYPEVELNADPEPDRVPDAEPDPEPDQVPDPAPVLSGPADPELDPTDPAQAAAG